MGGLFPSQGPTAFDAITSASAAALYLFVAVAALVHAPRDPRARVFFVTAIAAIAPYTATTYGWMFGGKAALARPVVGLVILSLIIGSLALLHFMQIFPWRRPWIRTHGAWLAAGYVALPAAAGGLIFAAPHLDVYTSPNYADTYAQITMGTLAVLLGLAIPLLVLVGMVIPFAGVLSLYKTWLAARREHVTAARVTTFWILISQLAGGVLTILIIPLLDLAIGHGWWTIATAALLFAFALLMPIAFAIGVWTFRVFDIDINAPPARL
jgi:hypothetical protein